jgi:hypothetical protein
MSAASDTSPGSTTPVCADGSGEWEQRTLCPDDTCIGVLGPDGRCCICGLRGDLSRPQHFAPPISSPPVADEGDLATAETAATAEPSTEAVEPDGNDDGFLRRELCPNDSCIGVLSATGSCPLCGSQR